MANTSNFTDLTDGYLDLGCIKKKQKKQQAFIYQHLISHQQRER